MPVQTSQHGLPPRAVRFFVGQCKCAGQGVNHRFHLRSRRLRLLFGWHLVEVELIENPLPDFQSLMLCQILAESVKADISLLLFGTVAFKTVLFKEGLQFDQ